MIDNLPSGTLKLGADLEVWLSGNPLPSAPNRSVAALLVGLVDLKGKSISRDEIASRLYPESSRLDGRNALRMTLIRLGGWIGSQYLEKDRDRIALLGDWDLTVGDSLPYHSGGAGIRSHPWVSEVVARSTGGVDLLASRLVETVELALQQDPDLARGIFVGARDIWSRAPRHQLSRLISATAPASPDRPFAFEHCVLASHYKIEQGDLIGAFRALRRGYRISQVNGPEVRRAQSLALLSTAAVEMGKMSLAAEFLRSLSAIDAPRDLDYYNALACFYWGEGNHDLATTAIRDGMKLELDRHQDQRERFLVNSGYYFSEIGEVEASSEIEVMFPQLADRSPLREQAKAYRLAHRGFVDEAEQLLLRIWRCAIEGRQQFPAIYASEAYVDILTWQGKCAEARRIWRWSGIARAKCGSGRTPRLVARGLRISRA